MAHVREQIRDALVVAVTDLATTGRNVFRSRIYPMEQSKLPSLAVYTKSESSDYATQTVPRTLIRRLMANIEAYVSANEDYDETIDDIASEIESALYTNRLFNGLAKDSKITGVEVEFSGDAENPVAVATFGIEITYVTTEGSPDTAV